MFPLICALGLYYIRCSATKTVKSEARQFLGRIQDEIARELPRRVILKYFPKLTYKYDDSLEQGHRVIELLDELNEKTESIE